MRSLNSLGLFALLPLVSLFVSVCLAAEASYVFSMNALKWQKIFKYTSMEPTGKDYAWHTVVLCQAEGNEKDGPGPTCNSRCGSADATSAKDRLCQRVEQETLPLKFSTAIDLYEVQGSTQVRVKGHAQATVAKSRCIEAFDRVLGSCIVPIEKPDPNDNPLNMAGTVRAALPDTAASNGEPAVLGLGELEFMVGSQRCFEDMNKD
ncbi:MAG: hypothetical protein M1833_001421 [Piccolia ochrophora]|nr:MAG: hypothetical protein M1833_001421 [Piccolia ochrophora]